MKSRLSAIRILGLALVLGVVGHWVGDRLQDAARSRRDELEWLVEEFGVSPEELRRIRVLHEAYRPQCERMCFRLAEGNRELGDLLRRGDVPEAQVESKLLEIARLRAECQVGMLRHFDEVAKTMPTATGTRYLATMRQHTLGMETSTVHSHP